VPNQLTKVGPYDIVELLRRGPRASVHVGRRPESGGEVAIKIATDGPRADEWPTASVLAATRLTHRNIVRILDVGTDKGACYIVMERLRGRTLRALLSDGAFNLDPEQRVDLVAQLCLGLHHAHEQQIVHGNVTPDNIFITEDGVTKILNFGETSVNDRTVVSDNALAGSFEYMSPEQIIGRDTVDLRSDIFSAATILYELVAGRRPFQAASTTATLARILRDDPTPIDGKERLNYLLRRALEKEPNKRFASAQEFAYSLWMLHLPEVHSEDESQAMPVMRRSGGGSEDSDTAPQQAIVLPPVVEPEPESIGAKLAAMIRRIWSR
jgi:serine/threonine protein kinase